MILNDDDDATPRAEATRPAAAARRRRRRRRRRKTLVVAAGGSAAAAASPPPFASFFLLVAAAIVSAATATTTGLPTASSSSTTLSLPRRLRRPRASAFALFRSAPPFSSRVRTTPRRRRRRRDDEVGLSMPLRSSSGGGSTEGTAPPSKTTAADWKKGGEVVYQKVVRPPSPPPPPASRNERGRTSGGTTTSGARFLPELVRYLREKFELPPDLPMVYEKSLPEEEEDDDDDEDKKGGGRMPILIVDSPLSNDGTARLDVEVVGICPAPPSDNGNDDDGGEDNSPLSLSPPSAPTMAVVAVRRGSPTAASSGDAVARGRRDVMLRNLFDDSERRILKALDRGLDDYADGRVRIDLDRGDDDDNDDGAMATKNVRSLGEALLAEMDAEEAEETAPDLTSLEVKRDKRGDVVIDTIATSVAPEKRAEPPPRTTDKTSVADSDAAGSAEGIGGGDFAVEAAKRAAAVAAALARDSVEPGKAVAEAEKPDGGTGGGGGGGDFAVVAARRRAAEKRNAASEAKTTTAAPAPSPSRPAKRSTVGGAARGSDGGPSSASTKPSPKPDAMAKGKEARGASTTGGVGGRSEPSRAPSPGRFRVSISHPKKRKAAKEAAAARRKREESAGAKGRESADDVSVVDGETTSPASPTSATERAKDLRARPGATSAAEPSATDDPSVVERKRNVDVARADRPPNLDAATEEERSESLDDVAYGTGRADAPGANLPNKDGIDDTVARGDVNPKIKTDDEIQRDVLNAASQIADEVASRGKDMTPEELLADVLKFGEEQEKSESVGAGFASGALRKARELLKEDRAKRETLLEFEELTDAEDGSTTTSAEEDELRRIFEAGERLAEGRIELTTTAVPSDREGVVATGNEECDSSKIDDLIESDRTVPRYARVIDDELAELEVRINRSPGEDLDGPRANPTFDVFSGPETYDPNVDPETAVNWPGAARGTKRVRLPKELEEARKHAEFAARMLSRLTTVGNDGDGDETTTKYHVDGGEVTEKQVRDLKLVASEAVAVGIIDDPLEYLAEKSRLRMVVDELRPRPEERFREIAESYKDLLLSENFVPLVRDRLDEMARRDAEAQRNGGSGDEELEKSHERERQILAHLTGYAQLLLKEARALGAELEAAQLEVVRSICKAAMDPSHKTEEETARALTDAVRDVRPLLDDAFVAYLKYAISEEEGKLARAGVLDDPEHNRWLFVLKIVREGVHAELARSVNRYVEHIWYVLRMESKGERRMLLERFVDRMPTLDVRPFMNTVENIAGALGSAARGEFGSDEESHVLGGMTKRLLRLRRDLNEMLPPERIASMSRDADECASKRRKKLAEQGRATRRRLRAARDTEGYDAESERRGEIERMT